MSNHELSPRYEIIQPPGPSDAETSSVKEPEHQLGQRPMRTGEVAIHQSRLRVLPRVCALLVPVAISFAILQLSWRHCYWRGSNERPHTISEDLAIFQIAVKAHEVLIVLSLSDVALHYLRQQLSSSQGLPFGLLIGAYQVALGSQPLSFGFFYAVKSSVWHRHIKWQSLALTVLLILATSLSLAAGPSSAVALIPRLGWWPNGDLFAMFTDGSLVKSVPFTMYIPQLLFPSVVDAASLPGPFCLEADLDINATCPSAGFSKLLPTLNLNTAVDNSTLDSGTILDRVLTTNFGGLVAASWTLSYVLTNYMSIGCDGPLDSPSTIEAMIQTSGHVMAPTVAVYCEEQPATIYNRNASAFGSEYGVLLNADGTPTLAGSYDIRDFWDESTLAQANTSMVTFDDNLANVTNPGLLAFVYTPWMGDKPANVTMCGINAVWEPNTMWVPAAISDEDHQVVASNFTWVDIDDGWYNPLAATAVHPLRIRKAWADTLNPANRTSDTSVLAQLLQDGVATARQQTPNGINVTSAAQAIMLSKAVADGLARVGAEYRINMLDQTLPLHNITVCRDAWCSSGTWTSFGSGLGRGAIRNATLEHLQYSYPKPDDVDAVWTRVAFPVKRYGYGWGSSFVTVQVATVILMLHTLIIIAHCCYLLCSGRSYNFVSSLGDLVALTLDSQAPAATTAASVCVDKSARWTRSTAVRELQARDKGSTDRLELVTGNAVHWSDEVGSLYRRPIVGKSYP